MKILLAIIIIISIYFLAVAFCLFYNKKLKEKGFDGIEKKECFSPIKQFSVIIGFLFKWIFKFFAYFIGHIVLQYIARYYDDDCNNCIHQGICKNNPKEAGSCGCDGLAKVLSPLEDCDKSRHGGFRKIIWSKKKFKKHYDQFPFRIRVEYGKFNELLKCKM